MIQHQIGRISISLVAVLTATAAPSPGADWYVVCDPISGRVLAAQGAPATDQLPLEGPLPGPRTAGAWIETNCATRRCNSEGRCTQDEATTSEAADEGGWVAGELTTVSSGSTVSSSSGSGSITSDAQPGVVASDPLAPLVETAEAAAEACAYPAALAAANHLTNFDPEHPWLIANHAIVRRLATRQKEAETQVWLAAAELEQGKLKDARELAFAATETAVSCQTPVVSDLVRGIDTAIVQRQQLRHAERRKLAASLLPSLIDLARVAGGGRPDTEDLASTIANSVSSTTAKLGDADPCAFQLSYDDPASVVPSCRCSGYRFDPQRFQCAR